MKHVASLSSKKLAAWALAGAALTGLTGGAFAGWLNHGSEIFLAMAETGLSWCF